MVRDLAGLSLGRIEDYGGIAAGRRIFLSAGQLFRAPDATDSSPAPTELFEPILGLELRIDVEQSSAADRGGGLVADQEDDVAVVWDVVRATVSVSHRQAAPLVGLVGGMRTYRTRQLSPTLARLALPLAIYHAGLVPKLAPALLGGRMPLAPIIATEPPTPWLARALTALAKEADGAVRRLDDLTRLHRGWHAVLAGAIETRGHAWFSI